MDTGIKRAIRILLIIEVILVLIIGVCFVMDWKEDKSDSKFVNQDVGNILAGTVDITIPKDFIDMLEAFGGNAGFDATLTEEQKAMGFIDVKKESDGSLAYTINKKDYENILNDMKTDTKQSLDEIATSGDFSSIKSVNYNDDFSKVTISANREKFENSVDSLVILSCGLSSYMYQIFDINATGKCTIEVKDVTTGEVFQTETYPKTE